MSEMHGKKQTACKIRKNKLLEDHHECFLQWFAYKNTNPRQFFTTRFDTVPQKQQPLFVHREPVERKREDYHLDESRDLEPRPRQR